MTLEDIKTMDKTMLSPKDVAPILGVAPYSLNLQAKKDIRSLGFNAMLIGTRLKIPKDGFICWYEGRNETEDVRNEVSNNGRQ